jgi:hypothetical protein
MTRKAQPQKKRSLQKKQAVAPRDKPAHLKEVCNLLAHNLMRTASADKNRRLLLNRRMDAQKVMNARYDYFH